MAETYILERTIEAKNCIVRVHRPELTEEEHGRRMRQIRKAAENLLRSMQN